MENNKNGYPSWMVQESQSNSYSYPGNTIGYSHGPAKDGYGQVTTGISQKTHGYFGDPYVQHSSGTQNTTGQNSWEEYRKLEFSRLCARIKENTKEKKTMSFNFGISIFDLNSIASILLAIAIFEILSYSSTIKSISAPNIPLIIDLLVLFCTNKFTGIRIFIS